MKKHLIALSLATMAFSSVSLAETTKEIGSVSVSATIDRPTCTASLSSSSLDFGNIDVNKFNTSPIGGFATQDLDLTLENCPSALTLKVLNSNGTHSNLGISGENYKKNGLIKDANNSVNHKMGVRVYSVTTGTGTGLDSGYVKLDGTPVSYDNITNNKISHKVEVGRYVGNGPNPALGRASTSLQYTLVYQ